MIRPRRGPSQPRTASPGSEYTGDDDDDDDDDAQSPIEAPPVEPSEGYAGGALADESGLAPTPRNHKSALPSLKLKLLVRIIRSGTAMLKHYEERIILLCEERKELNVFMCP
jgi:hypothetical protein